MDLTSLPGSPFQISLKHHQQARIGLAAAADVYRMAGKFRKAEVLYLEAATHATGMAAEHLNRMAAHCKAAHAAKKAK